MAIRTINAIVSGIYALATAIGTLLSGCNEEAANKGEMQQEPLMPAVVHQSFILLANEDAEITGAYGTKVQFPKNCFDMDHLPNDTVHVLMYEAYAPHQFIVGSIATMTDSGALLSTYGAIHLIALSRGDTLQLRSGKTLRVDFKSRSAPDKEPELFVGALQNSSVVWKDQSIGSTINMPLSDSIMIEGVMVDRESFVNSSTMDYYIYNITGDGLSKMGWFNCDVYPNDTIAKCSILVEHRQHIKASDWLIFPKRRGACSAYFDFEGTEGIRFQHIPVGEDVVYLSFYRHGSEYYLHKSVHRVSRGMTLAPAYQPINGPDALVDSLRSIQW